MADLSSIMEHLGDNFVPLMKFVSGAAYLIAIMFVWTSIKKLKKIADDRSRSGPGGQMFIPLAYFTGGIVLFFLPTMVDVAQNTLFGAESPLAYSSLLEELKKKYGDGSYAIVRFIQLAGVIWFIRGTILLVHASEPGVQHGPKGMAFLCGGIIAMNIKYTAAGITKLFSFFTTGTT